MRLLNKYIFLGLFIGISVSIPSGKVLADDLSGEICATVYPCLSSGEIIPEFDKPGYCGDQYRLLCTKTKASLMSDDLVSCQKENMKFKDNEAKLSKKIRSLRKKLRSAN